MVSLAARRGLSEEASAAGTDSTSDASPAAATKAGKDAARRTGVRGETYAYWYLRRRGYVIVSRNFTVPGMKGEIDLAGYDGKVLAFVEVKTRIDGFGEGRWTLPAGRRDYSQQEARFSTNGADVHDRVEHSERAVPIRCAGY